MPDESEFTLLRKRRAVIKGSCTRIKNYLESISAITPSLLSQIEERKIKLQEYWGEYDDVQSKLELIDEAESNDRVAFEEQFYNLSARMRDILRPPSTSRNVQVSSPAPSNILEAESPSNVRSPRLDLPKFSEKYDEWFPFYDTFYSVIHMNASLTNVHKLQYLRAATGDANKVISSLETSDTNYPVAWNLLIGRYNNKRAIVQNHLKSIIELPVMNKENAFELRQIADGAIRYIKGIKGFKTSDRSLGRHFSLHARFETRFGYSSRMAELAHGY